MIKNEIELLRWEVQKLEQKSIREISYKDAMEMAVKELDSTDETTIPSWGFKEFDETFWFLKWWQIYCIWWVTGTGKSTFVSQICQNVSQQWFRVSFYSLEDKLTTVRQNDLYFETNRQLKLSGYPMYGKVDFMNWKYKSSDPFIKKAREVLEKKNSNIYYLSHDDNVTIRVIEEMIKEAKNSWSKVVAIDHLHYFDSSDNIQTDRHDLVIKDIMHRINKLARDLDMCIILVAHYRKLGKWERPSLSDFSGSISIAQVANAIVHIHRDKKEDSDITEFIIDKNRDMGITKVLNSRFDIWTYEYKFEESKVFKKRANF